MRLLAIWGAGMKRFIEGVARGQSMLLPECLDDFIEDILPASTATNAAPTTGIFPPRTGSSMGFADLVLPELLIQHIN